MAGTDDTPEAGDEDFERFVEHLGSVLSLGTQGVLQVSDETASRIEELSKIDASERLREHYVLVGRLMSAMAALEGSVRVLTSYLLNPSEPGRAAAAIRTTGAFATLQIAADALTSLWTHSKFLVDEIRYLQKRRNQYAHNGLSHWHMDGDKVVEGVYLAIPDARKQFTDRFHLVKTDEIREVITRAELAAKVIIVVIQSLIASSLSPEEHVEGAAEIEVSAFMLAVRMKASGLMRADDGEDYFSDEEMLLLASHYIGADELEELRRQATEADEVNSSNAAGLAEEADNDQI